MLQPKRQKYRKQFRGKRRGVAQRGSTLSYGDYGLKALGRGWVSSNQIEAGRRAITHSIKRGGKVWIRIFPDKPITSRPAGQRMGGGKGEIDKYVAVVKPGQMLYEVSGIAEEIVLDAFKKAGDKMPFKCKIISKEN